jgi:hypothetical protein
MMKSIAVMVLFGMIGFVATAFNPKQEMWAPLIVALVPLMAFVMWPGREETAKGIDKAPRKAA